MSFKFGSVNAFRLAPEMLLVKDLRFGGAIGGESDAAQIANFLVGVLVEPLETAFRFRGISDSLTITYKKV